MRVTLDNAEGLLRPGLFGQMWIVTQRVSKAIVSPTEAIVDDARGSFALLQDEPGKIFRRAVKIGLRTPQQVEILDGLCFSATLWSPPGIQELGGLPSSHPAGPQRQEQRPTDDVGPANLTVFSRDLDRP